MNPVSFCVLSRGGYKCQPVPLCGTRVAGRSRLAPSTHFLAFSLPVVIPSCYSSSHKSLRFVSGHDFSRAEQGAEKVRALAPSPVKPAPSGAKAQVFIERVAARLKPCPDTKRFTRQVVDLFCPKSKGGASMLTTMSRSGCHRVGYPRTEANRIRTATVHLISSLRFVSGHDFSRAGLYQGTTSVVPNRAQKRSGL